VLPDKIPAVAPMFQGTGKSLTLLKKLYGVTGSRKSNMATTKPEILKSQLVDVVEKKYKRHHPCFIYTVGTLLTVASFTERLQHCVRKPRAFLERQGDGPTSATALYFTGSARSHH
jgi:hypothetical protein